MKNHLLQVKTIIWNMVDNLHKVNPSTCETVKAWSQGKPISYVKIIAEKLAESKTISRLPPRTIEPEIHPLFLDWLSSTVPEKYLACIYNAKVKGSNGVVILPDGTYTIEIAMVKSYLQKLPEYHSGLRHFLYSRSKKAVGTTQCYSCLHLVEITTIGCTM